MLQEKKVYYGLWDDTFNDLILVPGADGYAHSLTPDLKLLQFCAGEHSPLVRVIIEPLVENAGSPGTAEVTPDHTPDTKS